MKRTVLFLVTALCLLGFALYIEADQPTTQPVDEISVLQADNRMLKSTFERLLAEVATLKAENTRLRAMLKQSGIDPDKADAPAKSPDAPKEASAKGNNAVIKAVVEYAKKMDEINASDATQAQIEVAHAKVCEELTAVFDRQRVDIIYTVENVIIKDDNTAWVYLGTWGAIKSSVRDVPDMELGGYVLCLPVRVPRAAALQIKKGSSISLTGKLGLWDSNKYHDDFSKNHIFLGSPRIMKRGRESQRTVEIYLLAFRDGLAVTLAGSSVEVVDKK